MDQNIINLWEQGKSNLENYFKNNRVPYSYQEVVKALITQCLNFKNSESFAEEFTVIDDGDYQGTQLFILHIDVYQPSIYDYYVFDNYYGSCSACDTLEHILMDEVHYGTSIPTTEGVEKLMTLCLHMVQRMKKLK